MTTTALVGTVKTPIYVECRINGWVRGRLGSNKIVMRIYVAAFSSISKIGVSMRTTAHLEPVVLHGNEPTATARADWSMSAWSTPGRGRTNCIMCYEVIVGWSFYVEKRHSPGESRMAASSGDRAQSVTC